MLCWFWRLAETSAVASICFSNLCGGGLRRHVLRRSAGSAFAMVSRRRGVSEFVIHVGVIVPAHTVTPTSTPTPILQNPSRKFGRVIFGRPSCGSWETGLGPGDFPKRILLHRISAARLVVPNFANEGFWFQNPIPKSIATAADWYDVHWMLAGCRGNP
jgi:hypothetical protein